MNFRDTVRQMPRRVVRKNVVKFRSVEVREAILNCKGGPMRNRRDKRIRNPKRMEQQYGE